MTEDEPTKEETEAAMRRHPSQWPWPVRHPVTILGDQFKPQLRVIKGDLDELED